MNEIEVLEKKDTEFETILKDILENETVNQMRNYRHHYSTTCYEHCLSVAYYTYHFCKKHHLDYFSATRAAMLHDLFLYDWRERGDNRKGLHAFTHPRKALENSSQLFTLNRKEQDVILKHMWPLTVQLPKYKESYVVSFADKYSAMRESYGYYKRNLKFQKCYRYAYVFLSLLIFRVI